MQFFGGFLDLISCKWHWLETISSKTDNQQKKTGTRQHLAIINGNIPHDEQHPFEMFKAQGRGELFFARNQSRFFYRNVKYESN